MMLRKVYTRSIVILLSLSRAPVSAALYLLFALLLESCNLYDGGRIVHVPYVAV